MKNKPSKFYTSDLTWGMLYHNNSSRILFGHVSVVIHEDISLATLWTVIYDRQICIDYDSQILGQEFSISIKTSEA